MFMSSIIFPKVSAVLQSCDTGPVLTSWVKPMYLRSFTAQHRKQRNFPRLNSQAKIHQLTETSFLTHHSRAWQSLLPSTVFPTYHKPLLELILLQHSHLVGSKPLGCYSCPSATLTSPELCLTSALGFCLKTTVSVAVSQDWSRIKTLILKFAQMTKACYKLHGFSYLYRQSG